MSTFKETDLAESRCLKQLKLKLEEDTKLNKYLEILDDRFLLHFIRGKNYNVTRAFETLSNYIHLRKNKYKELFLASIPSQLPINIEMIRGLKLAGDDKGRVVVLIRFDSWDPYEIPLEDALLAAILFFEELLNHEETERYGGIGIIDVTGFNLKHARYATPFYMQRMFNILWNALPLKYHQIHIVNEPFYFHALLKAIKRFLPKKFRERMQFHGRDLSSLHKYLDPKILPERLGGKLSDKDAIQENFPTRILQNENFYTRFIEMS